MYTRRRSEFRMHVSNRKIEVLPEKQFPALKIHKRWYNDPSIQRHN